MEGRWWKCPYCTEESESKDVEADGVCPACGYKWFVDRISSLESALAERERECDRLRGELAGSDVNVRELWARAESAESALAAAREENERLRERLASESKEGK